jgi:hypothetical protein
VPPGFGQDVREWQMRKHPLSSHHAPGGADMSRPPSSLDCPLSPGDVAPKVVIKDGDRHRTDDVWDGDTGEQFTQTIR